MGRRGWLLWGVLWAGCREPAPEDRAGLSDPKACQGCHPDQYREWSGSMHAYASDDPVFLAMNARGQRETGGALGDFCVKCHAPLAVRQGLTSDGLNLAEVPLPQQGVSCVFCHQVESVEAVHDNQLGLGILGLFRGGIPDPVASGFHQSGYSELHDRNQLSSASLCGGCHDVRGTDGLSLERTFLEWEASVFARPDGPSALSCGSCHMPGKDGPAASVPSAPLRRIHDHSMPAVDLALTEFPQRAAQREAVGRALDTALSASLCVEPGEVRVRLDNVGAGHGFPSGAAHNRRAWVELVASFRGTVVFQSGLPPESKTPTEADDPHLWLLRERLLGASGQEVHFLWEAKAVESHTLPASVTLDPTDGRFLQHQQTRSYPVAFGKADQISVRVRLQPLASEVLDALVASGDLSAELASQVPTFTLAGTEVEWTRKDGLGCFVGGARPAP